MKPYIPLLSLLLLLLLQTPPAATGHRDIVIPTCEKCEATDPNVNYTLCIKSFDSVPKSHRSNLKGLGVIAAKLALANATSIRAKAKRVLRHHKPKSPAMKSCLQTCLELYSDSAQSLRDSARAIRARRYDDANTLLSSAVDAPATCEDGFGEEGIESPLTADNDEFSGHAVIALSMITMLQELVGH